MYIRIHRHLLIGHGFLLLDRNMHRKRHKRRRCQHLRLQLYPCHRFHPNKSHNQWEQHMKSYPNWQWRRNYTRSCLDIQLPLYHTYRSHHFSPFHHNHMGHWDRPRSPLGCNSRSCCLYIPKQTVYTNHHLYWQVRCNSIVWGRYNPLQSQCKSHLQH